MRHLPIDPNKVFASLRLLNLERSWQQLRSLPAASPEEARRHLAAWKDGALKPAYRELAKVHHPDHGGSEEKMKELSEAFNLLNSITLKNRPRGVRGRPTGPMGRPVRRHVVVVHVDIRGGAVRTDPSATTTGSGTSYVRVDLGTAATDGGTGNS
jgi:hypothetical protein